jgi:hypothetical protein
MNSVQESLGAQMAAVNCGFDAGPIFACPLSNREAQVVKYHEGNKNRGER